MRALLGALRVHLLNGQPRPRWRTASEAAGEPGLGPRQTERQSIRHIRGKHPLQPVEVDTVMKLVGPRRSSNFIQIT